MASELDPYSRLYLTLKAIGGHLSGFPNGHEAGLEPLGQNRAVDESTGFDPDHFGHSLPAIVGHEVIGNGRKGLAIFQQRRDVVEKNTGFGEVGTFG